MESQKKKWHQPIIRSLSESDYFSLLTRGDVSHAKPITSEEMNGARTAGLDLVESEVRTLYEFLCWIHISYENEAMRMLMLKLRDAYDELASKTDGATL